ncbi:unnamed protein product [Rhizophagus irregularis]|nr:unnamed protein product [Rhizophagus irregularis]CAB5319324.1 unnamed protein product [Rhizophagus irregularis]CAB5391783.1 unnamed protein product [Rhizophagus irregularis]
MRSFLIITLFFTIKVIESFSLSGKNDLTYHANYNNEHHSWNQANINLKSRHHSLESRKETTGCIATTTVYITTTDTGTYLTTTEIPYTTTKTKTKTNTGTYLTTIEIPYTTTKTNTGIYCYTGLPGT